MAFLSGRLVVMALIAELFDALMASTPLLYGLRFLFADSPVNCAFVTALVINNITIDKKVVINLFIL